MSVGASTLNICSHDYMLTTPYAFNKKTSYLLEEKKQRERDNERPSQSFPFHEANERMHHMDGEQVECAQS